MFHRVFIANRGEVAARLVRACRDMGIEPVCAASEPDLAAGFPYLKEAAEVVCLGPGAAADSYLKMEEVIQAARQTSCAALHPGWGFLAENSLFAALCEQHGVKFIGPSPAVMDQMGLKVAARAAATAAGLPVVPGSTGMLKDAAEAVALADSMGYPIVLKADAGGGGRGIRRCNSADEVAEAFVSASRESLAAFGNGDLYMEKYLVGGRHIEFQVIGDGRGNAIHLGERECSIQRRHQKLLEEAPSLALTAEQRDYYGGISAAATAAWNYAGVGTMEYLMADDGKLYFLEMNTRLQVEHPVTECITGIDLVQAQIRIAAGGELPCAQEDVQWTGHAIEVRLNAEDPQQDFRPAPGRIEKFDFPADMVRVDSHLVAGSKIPPHYDSLIAKMIAHGPDRAATTDLMLRALAQTTIEGVPTTAALHQRILRADDFQSGSFDTLWLTDFLER